jgi:hypothetical protein
VFGGRTGQGAVATRSRSCGSREVFGRQLVVVAMWFRVGMSPLLPTGYDGGRRRCAIGLVEPALRQGGPVLTTRTWRYLLLEAARTRVAAPHGLDVDSNLQLGVWPRPGPHCRASARHRTTATAAAAGIASGALLASNKCQNQLQHGHGASTLRPDSQTASPLSNQPPPPLQTTTRLHFLPVMLPTGGHETPCRSKSSH